MNGLDFFDEDTLTLSPREELFYDSMHAHKPRESYALRVPTKPSAHGTSKATDESAKEKTKTSVRSQKTESETMDTAYADDMVPRPMSGVLYSDFTEQSDYGTGPASSGAMFFSSMPTMYNRIEAPLVLVGLDTIAYAVGAGPRTIKRWMQTEDFPAIRCSDGVYRADPTRVRRWFYRHLA